MIRTVVLAGAWFAIALGGAGTSAWAIEDFHCGTWVLPGSVARLPDPASGKPRWYLQLFAGSRSETLMPLKFSAATRSLASKGRPLGGRFRVEIGDGGVEPRDVTLLSLEPVLSVLPDAEEPGAAVQLIEKHPCTSPRHRVQAQLGELPPTTASLPQPPLQRRPALKSH
jgi:hypothetical protein